MNKKDLVAKLKQLEGLTPDERAELINLLNTKKKYGLVWEDKPEDVEELLRTHLPVLREVVERRIIASPNPFEGGEKEAPPQPSPKEREQDHSAQTVLFEEDTPNTDTASSSSPLGRPGGAAPNHILIEGDNLHALTALTFTHEGKIDVIYIDPPYNTGNKDFKYNDAFVDKEDSYRHSKWLSFMHKRLEIAKRLLSDSGVIFISIDDNEQAQLKMLCDEVFGENNFIEIFSWVRTETPARLSKKSIKVVEYVLCYQKSDNAPNFKGFKSKSTSSNTLLNKPNTYKALVFPKDFVDTGLSDGLYKKGKYGTTSYKIMLEEDVEVKNGIFITPIVISANFRWGQDKLNQEIENGTKISIRTLTFSPSYEKKYYEAGAPKNLINRDVEVYTNEFAKRELEDFEIKFFDYPKPISLIKYLLSFTQTKNQTILDFFAGSGTTLHATIQLNAKDGGNRQCILVTNNENNICEEVTYERNKRVIQGYTNAKGVQVAGLANNNLRYFRSEYVGREKTHKNKRELVLAATELLCIKEDIYTELAELNGQKLDKKTIRCFSDKGRYLMVIYDEETIETLLPLISAINSHKKIKIYIFAPGQYPFTEEFEDVLDKVELCALPDAIYKAYANVLPKKKAKPTVMDSEEESTETETSESAEPNLFTV